jgi:C4-dicarboxylate transporter, DctM subunit
LHRAVTPRPFADPLEIIDNRRAMAPRMALRNGRIPALNRGHFKNIPYDFCLAGLIFSLPLITIGAANAFGWMLAYLRGAIYIADSITAIAGNDPHLIMLLMVLLFTVVGDFIELVPTIIIFMPMVNTLTQAGDINGVHMGVVLIATLAFGLITPPYGLVLLMASKFVGVPFSKALLSGESTSPCW